MNAGPNAETFRVRALIHLVAKNLAQAQLEIRKALELEPKWEIIRFTAATIDYFSALSPAVLPDHIVTWPAPMGWSYVKRDPESVTRLRRASEVFQELSGEEKTEDERQRLMSWRLACLANDGEKQEEAIQYCQEILLAYPTHYPAIVWAVARDFDVNLESSAYAFERLLEGESATIPHILGLVNCYLVSGKETKAIDVLTRTKSVFENFGEQPLWDFWYIQLLTTIGDIDKARQAISTTRIREGLRSTQSVFLNALSQQTGDWEPLIKHLEESYDETSDPNFLFESCNLMAQQQAWDYVADRAELLVEKFDTGEALRLAAIATHNANRFLLCLRLLDENQDLFGQKLPIELRRIRISCQASLGILPQAIAEAQMLTLQEPTVDNLLRLAQLYFDKGDLRGVTIIAQKLVNRSGLDSESSLRIARLVQWEDRELSEAFWRKAVCEELPDPLVGDALAIGYRLGLDKEVKPLLSRMVQLGQKGSGNILAVNIQDVIEHAKQYHERLAELNELYFRALETILEGDRYHERLAELNELYRNGTAPIHLIAEQLNLPLVNLYHGNLKEYTTTMPNPIRQPLLLIRHGGRGLVHGFPKETPKWRLNLDITSLLLAAHLEILDQVEEIFRPLRIPALTTAALLQMRYGISHHQPSRIESNRQIIRLVDQGAIQVSDYSVPTNYPSTELINELGEEFVASLEKARVNDACVVCFLPLIGLWTNSEIG